MTGSARPQRLATDRARHRCFLARAAAVLIAVTACGVAAVAEDDTPADVLPPLVQPPQGNITPIDFGENFDGNVFNRSIGTGFVLNNGGGKGARPSGWNPESGCLSKVRDIANEQLSKTLAGCDLTEAQRRKVQLAIDSDVRRTAGAIDTVRRKYHDVRVRQSDPAWQTLYAEFQKDIETCRQSLQSLCGKESFVMKALPTTLDAEQLAHVGAEADARRACRWRAIVVREMIRFDDVLGLDAQQHEKLESLLLAERVGLREESAAQATPTHLGPQLVGLVLTRIDDARLAAILSPRQVKFVRQFANSCNAMRPHLERMGLIEKEPS